MEVAPGIHKIDGVTANSYLVVDGKESILIDTGMPRSGRKIIDYISDYLKMSPGDVRHVVLTHHHVDHAGGASELKERLAGTKLVVHRADADFVSGRSRPPTPAGAAGVMLRALSPLMRYRRVSPDLEVGEGDSVGRLTVIHLPGHTPGSMALHDPRTGALFVGDALGTKDGRIRGPPKRFTADMKSATTSIHKLSELKFDILLCGHGQPVKEGASAKVREFYNSSIA
ncbi:MAG: MBL fold metallo-hydrolase [Nitrososphaerota archaeon]|nr:MBL fold metallo-hydrolase [Nitrososphaerota archaeon]